MVFHVLHFLSILSLHYHNQMNVVYNNTLNQILVSLYKYQVLHQHQINHHFLLDIKNPDEQYSVCDYQIDARNLLKKYQNKNIIVVGGTGLYLKALFYDYNFSNKKNNDYDIICIVVD